MYKKIIPFVALIGIGFIASSCEQNELEEAVTASAVNTENAASGNFFIEETFESGSGLDAFHSDDFAASHSFTLVSNPAFAGSKAARIELRDSDPMVSSGTRAEMTVIKDESTPHMTKDMWYNFAVFFPSVGYEADAEKEIISQWHQSGGQSPPISLIIRNDKVNIEVRNEIDAKDYFEIGNVVKDKWQQYTFHIIHSKGSDGIVEIWNNGTKIFTHKGANLYQAGDDLPKWKMGMYKWKWNGSETTNTKKRVLYFDNIRVGKGSASLAEMTQGGGTAAPAPTEPTPAKPTPTDPTETNPTVPVVPTAPGNGSAFTVVDAGSDRDLVTLANGASLSLSALKSTRFNIRYNSTAIPAGGSAKFELTGTKNHTFADNAAPYAVFGDDGKGNYYHENSLLSPGQYTLKVTPYSEAKGRGTAGTPVAISFTVVK
jgi:hypothetical protein